MKLRSVASLLVLAALASLPGCGGGSAPDDTADVAVTGTGPSEPVAPGGVATFVMTVSNAGPDQADDILLQNIVDNRLTLQSFDCEATGGAVCPEITVAGNSASCIIGVMPLESTLVFTVRALVPVGVNGLVYNNMFTLQPPEDFIPENNASTVSAVVANAQLVASYSAPDVESAGSEVAFVATVDNLGPGAAAEVEMARTVPAGTSAGSTTCQAFDGAVCPADLTADPLVAPLLPAGSRLRLQFPIRTPSTLRGDITSRFSAGTPSDPQPDNNSADATTTIVAPSANLAVTHQTQTPVVAGTNAVFTAQVFNRSTDSAFDVHLALSLPAAFAVGGPPVCVAGGGATCPAAPAQVMDLAVLPAGGTLVFNYVVPVPLTAAGSEITAVFSATADGDPASEDNTREATATVVAPSADLQVSQTAPAEVESGAALQFTAVVTNFGPDAAHGVTLSYTLSGAAIAPGVSCTAFSGATCPAAPSTSMLVAELPAGGSLQFSVATSAGSAGSEVTGTMRATSADDTNSANDSDSDTVAVVVPAASLSSVVSVASSSGAGGSAFFSARVTNGGPNTATNLVLDFELDPASFTVSDVDCQASASAVCPPTLGTTTSVPELAAGAWLQLSFEVPLPSTTPLGSAVGATFSAAADGDPATGDNVAEGATTVVAAPADVGVSVSAAGTTPVGSDAEFVVIVANFGPTTASDVTVTQTLAPAATATISCTALLGAACPLIADPASFTIDALPAGSGLRLVYTVPTASLAANTALTATLRTIYEGDTAPANDEASASTTLTP